MINLKSPKFLPAFYAGLITAGIQTIPGVNLINVCCCAGIILGGFLAVFFYTQQIELNENSLTQNDCMELAVWTGIISAVAYSLMSLIISLAFGNLALEIMLSILNNMLGEIPNEMQILIEEAKVQEITIIRLFFSVIVSLIVNIIASIIGGVLAWNFYKNKYGKNYTDF